MKLVGTRKTSALIALASIVTLTVACGGKSGGKKKKGDPDLELVDPAPTPTPEPPAKVEPPKEKPPKKQPAKFGFKEIEMELPGDFRVLKVMSDKKNHYYAAMVSDVQADEAAPSQPGYMLVKFDATGKELWRFPTRENVAYDEQTSERIGSYMLGSLSDMHVSQDGEVLLVGLRHRDHKVTGSSNWLNYNQSKWPVAKLAFAEGVAGTARNEYFANVAFVSKIRGAGTSANSPKFIFNTTLVAPIWWQPQSIQTGPENTLILESSSGGKGGMIQQVQRLDQNFQEVYESACYASQNINTSSGTDYLINVAESAPQELVNTMTKALAAEHVRTVATAEEDYTDFEAKILKNIRADAGRCWDLIGSEVMPANQGNVNIVAPTVLAEGQTLTSRIESLSDMLYNEDRYDAYNVTNEYVAGSSAWAPNPMRAQYLNFEDGYASWQSIDGELIHLGLDQPNRLGTAQLVIGNGRTFEDKSWQVDLRTNSQRKPGSMALVDNKDKIFVSWTDMHLPGETFAANRSLRLVAINKADKKPSFYEFDVPERTGHRTFSSVRLAKGPHNFPAVFATVGTRDASTAPGQARMQAVTLLLGVKQ